MKNILLFLLLPLLLAGCMSSYPDSAGTTSPDVNQRQEVRNPHYRKRTNGFGVIVSLGATAGAGYYAYEHPFISYAKGGEVYQDQIASAALAGLLAYSSVAIINLAAGKNTTKAVPSSDYREWLRKADNDFVFVRNTSGGFVAIPKRAEQSFVAASLLDAQDFATAFPNSSRSTDIAGQALNNVPRSEIIELMRLYPGAGNSSDMKRQYVLRSTSVGEAIDARERFPEFAALAEERAAALVQSVPEALAFGRGFSRSSYATKVVEQANKQLSQASRSDVLDMISLFPGSTAIITAKKHYITTSGSLDEYLASCRKFSGVISPNDQSAVVYVKTVADARRFQSEYPSSSLCQKFQGGVYVGTISQGVTIMDSGDTYTGVSLSSAKQSHGQVLAERERQRKAKEERDRIIREYGADYVVDKSCHKEWGPIWQVHYERCSLVFADGTASLSKGVIRVDGYWGFDERGSWLQVGDSKILYESFELAAKQAYRMAKGQQRTNEGRYYPPQESYSSGSQSAVSSSQAEIISSSNAKITFSSSPYLGIRDGDNSQNPSSGEGSNYLVVITDSKGKELERFTNEYTLLERGNRKDNSIFIANYNFPIIVNISYSPSDSDLPWVSGVVKLSSPCTIDIVPN